MKKFFLGASEIALITALNILSLGEMMILEPYSTRTLGRSLRAVESKIERNTRVVQSLLRKGLVKIDKKKESFALRLTDQGRKEIQSHIELAPRDAKRAWDGLWRIVLFDISETERAQRDALRYRLEKVGFLKIQDSAWIFPFPCGDLVESLKEHLNISQTVIFVTDAHIENDGEYKKKFGLH